MDKVDDLTKKLAATRLQYKTCKGLLRHSQEEVKRLKNQLGMARLDYHLLNEAIDKILFDDIEEGSQ
jgi:hypothetical protein